MGLLHEPSFRLFLGVALVIYGCWNSAMGMAFIKQSSDVERDRRCICRPRFWIGTLILLGNSAVVDLTTFSLLPISMIAPFAGLTIVFSLIIANTGCLGPKETITLTDGMHISLVLIGVTVVSLFGPQSGVAEVRYEQIMSEFKSAGFILYAAINLGIVSLWVVFTCVPSLKRHLPSEQMQGQLFVTVFSAYAASTCGALSKIFLKVVAAAARQFFSDSSPSNRPGPFGEWRIYVAGALLGACAILQIYLLNATLASSPVGIAVPMYQSMSIVLTILAGGAFFHEFAEVSPLSLFVFILGVACATAGLALLSRATTQDAGESPMPTPKPSTASLVDSGAPAADGGGKGRSSGSISPFGRPGSPVRRRRPSSVKEFRFRVPLTSQVALGLTAMYEAARDAARSRRNRTQSEATPILREQREQLQGSGAATGGGTAPNEGTRRDRSCTMP